MANGFIALVRTDKDVDFTGALAQNAIASANVTLGSALSGPGGGGRGRVRSISIISDQNLDWELQIFGRDTFITGAADIDAVAFLGRVRFTASTDAFQTAGSGPYYYYREGLDLPLVDLDQTGELHLALINRSATGKNAGATGEIVVQLAVEEMGP